MKKGIVASCLFALLGVLQAQESAVLPTGYYLDFKQYGFGELKSVRPLIQRANEARVMLSGENHMFSGFNSLGEYRFLKFFHEQAGVRHFVIELSPTRALYMERYFTNTDSTARRFLRATSSQDYMNLFDSIRVWNQTLPDSQKIKVHGLDVERFYDMTVMRLGDVIQKRGMAPPSIRMGALMATKLAQQIEKEGTDDEDDDMEGDESTLEGISDTTQVVVATTVDTTRSAEVVVEEQNESLDKRLDVILMNEEDDDFDTEEGAMELYVWLSKHAAVDGKYADSSKVWKQWLGDDFAEYALAFKQLREWYLWTKSDNTAQQVAWREEHMYKNMVGLLQKYPQGKFFGQFGRCHVSTNKQQQDCGWFEYNSLLTRLRTRYFKENKSVMSIGIFYKEKEFDGKDICAVNLGSTLAINEEVKSILKTVDKSMVLYHTKDSITPLVELSKKFDFVLAHDFTAESEEDDDYSGSDDAESKGNDHIGFTVAGRYMMSQFLSENLNQHFADNGYAISDAKLFYVPLGLTFLSKHGHMELGYARGKKDVFKANDGERLSYRANMYHMDAGVHSGNSYAKWQWGLGMRAYHVRHQIKYVPPTVDFGNPVVNGVQTIRSMEWVPGAYVSARFRPHAGLSLFAKAGYQQSMAAKRVWQYKETGLNYGGGTDMGGLNAGMFVEMGFTVNMDTFD